MTQQDVVIWGFSIVNASIVYLLLRYTPLYNRRNEESEEDITKRIAG